MKQRIHKLLASCGIASRRKIEIMIDDGLIKVDGNVALKGMLVDLNSNIVVDGQRIDLKSRLENNTRVIAYHKPEGKVCTRHDPEGRRTIYEDLPGLTSGRWISVGRLDLNTSGLLLLTTNGDLAHRLMHPSFTMEREYIARIYGDVTQEIVNNLTTGVDIDGEIYKFNSVSKGNGVNSNHWYTVTLNTGRNREVRKLWESQEQLQVNRLIRVKFGPIPLPRWLKPGKFIELSEDEIEHLSSKVKLLT